MGKKKWVYNPQQAFDWWNSLSVDEKVDYKNRFEIFRNREDVIKQNYPNMYDLTDIRLSQLGNKHIVRIWVFKDRL
jgi:hypothetical protein